MAPCAKTPRLLPQPGKAQSKIRTTHYGTMQRFGEKLRILRERHGLSQRDLGKQLGFASSAYVHFLETGQRKPNVELLLKLSELFGVTVDVLVKDALELDA